MTATSTRHLDPCPACNGSGSNLVPDLPSLPIVALVVGTLNLLQEAAGLPQPHFISICDTQSIRLQFAPEHPSLRAITRWALRFGGVVVSEPHQGKTGPETWCRVKFSYHGVPVSAYAHIPAVPAS